MKALALIFKSNGQGLLFLKVGQSQSSRSKGQGCWYPVKGLSTNIIYVKYKCLGVYCSKDMAKVNFKIFM